MWDEDTTEDSYQKPIMSHRPTKFAKIEKILPDGTVQTVVKRVRRTFDDQAKADFLEAYAKHGRMGDAARSVGFTTKYVREALQVDEQFAEDCMEAEENYRCQLIEHVQNLVFHGTKKRSFDRNGNIVSEEIIYPIRLIEMEMKKHDKGYTDRKEVDLNVSGGILIAPKETESISDWENRFGKKDEMIDVTPTG